MKTPLGAALVAACLSLALAGCGTTSLVSPVDNPITLPTVVQQDAAAACGYVPTASTLAQLIATYSGSDAAAGIAELAGKIATDICAAVTAVPAPAAKSARFGARRAVSVHGVVVHGRFVR